MEQTHQLESVFNDIWSLYMTGIRKNVSSQLDHNSVCYQSVYIDAKTTAPQKDVSVMSTSPDTNKKNISTSYCYQHLIDAMDEEHDGMADQERVTQSRQYSQDESHVTGNERISQRRSVSNGRPPYSYIALICMAISSNATKRANLRQIVHYIEHRFPYYRSDKRWHGTLRHHLSINDCFVKLPRRSGEKLCQWMINPEYADMFDNGSLLRRRFRSKRDKNEKRQSKISNNENLSSKVDEGFGAVKLDACNLDSVLSMTSSPAIHATRSQLPATPHLSPISTTQITHELSHITHELSNTQNEHDSSLMSFRDTRWQHSTSDRSCFLSSPDCTGTDTSGSDMSHGVTNSIRYETPIFQDGVTNYERFTERTNTEVERLYDTISLEDLYQNHNVLDQYLEIFN